MNKGRPPGTGEFWSFLYEKKPENLEFPKLADMPERLKKATEALGGVRVVARKLQFNYRGHLGGPNNRWDVYAAKLDQVMDEYDFDGMWDNLTPAMARALSEHGGPDAVKWRFFEEEPARALRAARSLFDNRKYDSLDRLMKDRDAKGKLTGALLEVWPAIEKLAEKSLDEKKRITDLADLNGVKVGDPYPTEEVLIGFIVDETIEDLNTAIRVYLYRPVDELKTKSIKAVEIFPWDQAERRIRLAIDNDFGAYVEALKELAADPDKARLMAGFMSTHVGKIAGINSRMPISSFSRGEKEPSIEEVLGKFYVAYTRRREKQLPGAPFKPEEKPVTTSSAQPAPDPSPAIQNPRPTALIPDGFRVLTPDDILVKKRTALYHTTYGLGVYIGGHTSLSDAEREIQIEFTVRGKKKSMRFHASSLRYLFILEDESKLHELKKALQGPSPRERSEYRGLAERAEETLKQGKLRYLYFPEVVFDTFVEASKRGDDGMDKEFADKLLACIAYVERAIEGIDQGVYKFETMTKFDQLLAFEVLGLGLFNVTPGKARKLLRENIQGTAEKLGRTLDKTGRISRATIQDIIRNQADKDKRWSYVATLMEKGNEQDFIERLILEAVPRVERVLAYETEMVKKEGAVDNIPGIDPRPIGEIPDISKKAEPKAKGVKHGRPRPGKGLITGETLLSVAFPLLAVLALPALIILAFVYRDRIAGWFRGKEPDGAALMDEFNAIVPGLLTGEDGDIVRRALPKHAGKMLERQTSDKDKVLALKDLVEGIKTLDRDMKKRKYDKPEEQRSVYIMYSNLVSALNSAPKRRLALGLFRNMVRNRLGRESARDLSYILPGAPAGEYRIWFDSALELARSNYDGDYLLWGCFKSLEDEKEKHLKERAGKIRDMMRSYRELALSITKAGHDPLNVFKKASHLLNGELTYPERIEMLSSGKSLAEKGIDPSGYFIDALINSEHMKAQWRLPAIRAIKGLYEEYYSAPYHVKLEDDTVVDTRVSRFVRYDEYVRIFRAEINIAGKKRVPLGDKFAGSATSAWRAMNAIVAGGVDEDINIMLTYKCPFNCAHCLAKEMCGSVPGKDTPPAELYSLFDQLEGFDRAHLCGAGEPLCYGKKNLMESGVSREFLNLVKYAAGKVKELRIVTSAYLVPENIDEARKFFAQFPSNVVWLVSADYEHEEMYDLLYPRGEEKDSRLVRIIRTMEKLSAEERRIKTAYNIRLKEKNDETIREIIAHFGLEKKYARTRDIFIDKILAQGNAVLNYPGAEQLDIDDIARHNYDPRAFFPFIDPEGYFLSSNHMAYKSPEGRKAIEERLRGMLHPQVIGNVRKTPLAELVIEELLLKRFDVYNGVFMHKRIGPGIDEMSRRKEWGIHYDNNCIPVRRIIAKAIGEHVLGRDDAARTYLNAVCGGKSKEIRWDIIDILYHVYIKCPELGAGELVESVLENEFFAPFKEKNGISLLEAFHLLGKHMGERQAIEKASVLNFTSVWNGFPREWIRSPRIETRQPATGNRQLATNIPCPVYPVHPTRGIHPNMYKRDDELILNGFSTRFILDEISGQEEGAVRFNEANEGNSSIYPNVYGVLKDQESGRCYAIREDTYDCEPLYRAAINGVCTLAQYEGEKHSALSVEASNLGMLAAMLDKEGLRPDMRKGIDLSRKFKLRQDYTWFVEDRNALTSDPALKTAREVLFNMFIKFARTAPVRPFPDEAVKIARRAFREGYEHEMPKSTLIRSSRYHEVDESDREARKRKEISALGIDPDRETGVAGAFWDCIAGMTCDSIAKARSAGKEEEKYILALERSWIENDSGVSSQIGVIEEALKKLKRAGHDNIIFIEGEAQAFAAAIDQKARAENIPLSNIIVIGGEDTLFMKKGLSDNLYDKLLRKDANNKAFLFGVDAKQHDPAKGLRIFEMFMLAMKLRSGAKAEALDQRYVKINDKGSADNKFTFTPVESLDIDKFGRLSRVQEKALDTKA
ncbi:MAG: hypothetical protein HQL30_12490 [Candidatus Omnitrophica bacterium]|nr:hypothetical protein [Candidatus Omnitrophota bacterium]